MAGRPLTGNLRIMARDKIIETQAAKLKNYERAMDYLCTVVPKLAECLQADPDFSARSIDIKNLIEKKPYMAKSVLDASWSRFRTYEDLRRKPRTLVLG